MTQILSFLFTLSIIRQLFLVALASITATRGGGGDVITPHYTTSGVSSPHHPPQNRPWLQIMLLLVNGLDAQLFYDSNFMVVTKMKLLSSLKFLRKTKGSVHEKTPLFLQVVILCRINLSCYDSGLSYSLPVLFLSRVFSVFMHVMQGQ